MDLAAAAGDVAGSIRSTGRDGSASAATAGDALGQGGAAAADVEMVCADGSSFKHVAADVVKLQTQLQALMREKQKLDREQVRGNGLYVQGCL